LAPPKPNEFIDNKLFGNLNKVHQSINYSIEITKSHLVFSVTTFKRPSVKPGISVFGA